MKALFFVFLFISAWNVNAQTSPVEKLFSEGTSFARAGHFDSALGSYKAALDAAEKTYAGNEFRSRLHYNIGLCYFRLDRFVPAANEFKKSMLLTPDYAPAYAALNHAKRRVRLGENLNAAVIPATAGK